MFYNEFVATCKRIEHVVWLARGGRPGHKPFVVGSSITCTQTKWLGIVATGRLAELRESSRTRHTSRRTGYSCIKLLNVIQSLHLCSISSGTRRIRIRCTTNFIQRVNSFRIPVTNFCNLSNFPELGLRESKAIQVRSNYGQVYRQGKDISLSSHTCTNAQRHN